MSKIYLKEADQNVNITSNFKERAYEKNKFRSSAF